MLLMTKTMKESRKLYYKKHKDNKDVHLQFPYQQISSTQDFIGRWKCLCTHKALQSNSLNCNGYLIFPVYLEIRKGDGVGSSLTSLHLKFLIEKKKKISCSDKIESIYELKLFGTSCATVNLICEKQVHFRVLNSLRTSVNHISIEEQVFWRHSGFQFQPRFPGKKTKLACRFFTYFNTLHATSGVET